MSREEITAIASKLAGESRALASEPALRLTINQLHSPTGFMHGFEVMFFGEPGEHLWVLPETENEWSCCVCTFVFPSAGTFLLVAQFTPGSEDSVAKVTMYGDWGNVVVTSERGRAASVSTLCTHDPSSGHRHIDAYFTCQEGPAGIVSFEAWQLF